MQKNIITKIQYQLNNSLQTCTKSTLNNMMTNERIIIWQVVCGMLISSRRNILTFISLIRRNKLCKINRQLSFLNELYFVR
jgi:hypothetical protein